MRKIIIFVLSLILLATALMAPASAEGYDTGIALSSSTVFLASINNDEVICSIGADEPRQPAAMSGIACAMAVINSCPDINALATVPDNIVARLSGTQSALLGLKPGEQLSYFDLLHFILVRSAADVSYTLAVNIAGDEAQFVALMNQFAASAGCTSTNFTNCTGLDSEGQFTTARDVYRMAKAASANEVFVQIASSTSYSVEESQFSGDYSAITTLLMVKSGFPKYYSSSILWGKSGATSGAGRCVCVQAAKNGYAYIAVVMGGQYIDTNGDGEKENFAFIDCRTLLDWTFSNIRIRRLLSRTDGLAEIKVKNSGKIDYLILVPEQDVDILAPASISRETVLVELVEAETPTEVKAPVKKGEVLGRAQIKYANTIIAQVPLVASEEVSFSLFGTFGRIARSILTSPIFIIIALIVIILLAAYFVLGVRYDIKRKRLRMIRSKAMVDVDKLSNKVSPQNILEKTQLDINNLPHSEREERSKKRHSSPVRAYDREERPQQQNILRPNHGKPDKKKDDEDYLSILRRK